MTETTDRAAETRIALPELHPGEHYAGLVLDVSGQPEHHLVLMASVPDNRLSWKDAMAWAERVGGVLPTRQEQALLFATCKQHIAVDWYWSSEQFSASGAWSQAFSNGYQSLIHQSAELRARAVRRV